MLWGSANPLTLFLRPEWLAVLPLAVLPFVRELLRPTIAVAVPAGWSADHFERKRSRRFGRWLMPALLAFGFVTAALALAGPNKPVIRALETPRRGHFRSVVLDCSGSMSIVDPGRKASRLRILADDLAAAVHARTQDRFAVVRVAGYADRIGPADSGSRFLVDTLRQITPAQPGEDGTNLGDGLVIAADALPASVERDASSILIVSDGRENPPDARSFRVQSVVPELLRRKMRVDWLRLDLPAASDESPDSRERAEASRKTLEKLVNESGGAVIEADANGVREADFEAAMAKLTAHADEPPGWPTAATACLILALVCWSVPAVSFLWQVIEGKLQSGTSWLQNGFITAATAAIGAAVLSVAMSAVAAQTVSGAVTSRWVIVMDASPSMAAGDAADGSRLAAAKKLARGLIGRLSLDAGARAAIVRFSGRAIPESGLTDDWRALESIVDETGAYAIRPTGSDWDAALEAVRTMIGDDEPGTDSIVPTNVVFLTDGEASRGPSDEIVASLADRKCRLHFVTFGDDQAPGAVFPMESGSNRPWSDRRSGKPARSARNEDLADKLAAITGGKAIVAGTADFDPWELARTIAGPVDGTGFRNLAKNRPVSNLPFRLTLLAIAIFLIGECAGILGRAMTLSAPGSKWKTILPVMLFVSISCSKPGGDQSFESVEAAAWNAYESGYLTRAHAILQFGADQFPDEPAFAYDIALIESIRNRPEPATKSLDEAETRLERNDTIEPSMKRRMQARIRAARGYAALLAGQPKKAAELYSAAISNWGLSEAELADARTNAKFAASFEKPGPEGPGPEAASRLQSVQLRPDSVTDGKSPDAFEIDRDAGTLERMADEARGRARAARERFEPAGDETKTGMTARTGSTGTIDW